MTADTTDLRIAALHRRLLDDLEGLFDARLPQKQYDRGIVLIEQMERDIEEVKGTHVRTNTE